MPSAHSDPTDPPDEGLLPVKVVHHSIISAPLVSELF